MNELRPVPGVIPEMHWGIQRDTEDTPPADSTFGCVHCAREGSEAALTRVYQVSGTIMCVNHAVAAVGRPGVPS